jgi:hypothetical protein
MMIRWLPLLMLAGCIAHQPIMQQQPPQKQEQAATSNPVSAVRELLQPCPIAELRRYTSQDVTRVANARRDALIQCNKDNAAALSKLEQP